MHLITILLSWFIFCFQDSTFGLKGIEETEQTFKSFLGEHEKIIYDIRQCPVNRISLCVTSDAEYEKCVKMRVILIVLIVVQLLI